MKAIKSIFSYAFSPKRVIFLLALYNFISLWFASKAFTEHSCLVCPWYFDWSFTNEPTILLAASSFLMISRFRSYLTSVILSGFIFIKGLYLINNSGWKDWIYSLILQLQNRHELETEILRLWETQLVLAIVIFSTGMFYAFRKNISKDNLR